MHNFVGDKNYHLGNILSTNFEDILSSPKMQQLKEEEKQKIQKLSACQHFDICNGGCPHDRYIAQKYTKNYTGKCCGQSKLIAHITKALSQNIGKQNMAELGHVFTQ